MGVGAKDILLVEDNSGDARLVELMLSEMDDTDYCLTKVDRMSEALDLLDDHDFQAAILDMSLPDGEGVENISRIKARVADLPIVVLGGCYDEAIALETVKAGAQDYLVKGEIDEWQLSRALKYAVERKRLQEDVVYMAHHDQLTDLANRTLFHIRLEHAIKTAERRNELVALLYMDLDHFKPINDALGHDVGDKLLIEVAKSLKESVREVDTVGRLGGDEFAIILEGIEHRKDVIQIAKKIIINLSKELRIDDHSLYIGTSIGIAMYPQCGEDADVLIKNADSAMYKAKRSGGTQYQFYSRAMNSDALEELTMEMRLREALNNEEFILHYQPKYDLKTGELSGSEALLRWQSPEIGLLHPSSFIPQLEQNGLITEVGRWVLESACKQHALWKREGRVTGKVAVNLSGRQLLQTDFAESVAEILANSGLDSSCLELELTESLMIQNTKSTMRAIEDLRAMGVSIAIDDFGTGYSSFNYLKRFVIDTLKIDRSFIQNITKGGADAAITSAITRLSKDLGIQVVAEGVETREQLDYLREQYIDQMQGFYMSPPLSVEEFSNLDTNSKQIAVLN